MPIQNSIPKFISCRISGTTNTSKMPTLYSNVTGTFTAPMQEIFDADARVQLSTPVQSSTPVECNWNPSARNFRHPADPTKTRFAPESSRGMGRFAAAVSPPALSPWGRFAAAVSPPFESHNSCHDRFNIYRVCNPHF
jgi:hypothetical protein